MGIQPIHKAGQSGLTLVEILIAVLIISVGLLGVAGLHAFSLRSNYDALMRSHASELAADIADRMRANRTAALEGDYDIALADGPPDISGTPEVSQVDLNEWLTALSTTLPQGDGEITFDAATNLATITIQWGERRAEEDEDDDPMQFVTQTEI